MDVGLSEAERFWTACLRDFARCGLRSVKLRSTSPPEGLNGEIGRRTEFVGIVLSEAAVTRLVGAHWRGLTDGPSSAPAASKRRASPRSAIRLSSACRP